MPLHPLIDEWDADLRSPDPLGFPGYGATLAALDAESVRTGLTASGYVLIEGRFDVIGGSMGAATGEKVVRAFRRAIERRLPVVAYTHSGGARLQEGMVALSQMARTAGAARAHQRAGLLSLAVLGAPTTGGVYASYGSIVDLRAAEAGATIGFAGPRVVQDTLGVLVPLDSHRAEWAYAHGLVDAVVAPSSASAAAREWVEAALGLRVAPLPERERGTAVVIPEAGAWGDVLRARAPGRPTGIDWAARVCTSWVDLHGSDPTVRAGLATIDGRRVVVVATDRYATPPLAVEAGAPLGGAATGRPTPAGFRLAQRAIALAGRLGLPLVSLVDTPGAHPGVASEADGIAGEIARTFAAMEELPTVSVSLCVGEGGSGGALALAHADRLLMLRHSIFSVIPPEGAASILDRDPGQAPVRAGQLKLTAPDLLELGIADGVIAEHAADAFTALVGALDDAKPGDRRRRGAVFGDFDAAADVDDLS